MSKSRKQILINIDDVPSKLELVHAVSRLRRDYDLLSQYRGRKDKEDPESFRVVAAFLEMLIKREGKRLPKRDGAIDDSLDVLIDLLVTQLNQMDDWELKQTVQETALNDIVKKLK